MRLPPHGRGALKTGNIGNVGGPGVPPSALRQQLRGSYAERVRFLDRVIDGEVMQRVELPLFTILPHIACPNCGELGCHPSDDSKAALLTFEAQVSASVRDRIMALEHQAKYGMGALKEVSVENVRERVAATLAVIRDLCPRELAETTIAALRPVWAA